MSKIICPCCKEIKRLYCKLRWDKSVIDFACGNCRFEVEIPKNIKNIKEYVLREFEFNILDPIREKVNSMTREEKISRLAELTYYSNNN